jgi:hypothetical protein
VRHLSGLTKSAQLGGKLRINGTPAIFFASGERVGGYVPAAEIEKALRRPRRLSSRELPAFIRRNISVRTGYSRRITVPHDRGSPAIPQA